MTNKSKAMVSMKDMEEAMAAQVSDATARIHQPAGNVIGIQNSKFTYKQEVIGDELTIIILDFIHQKCWYDSSFNRDNPMPPACFAQSIDGDEMQAHKTSPAKQSDWCDGCEKNAWGSSTTGSGEGKACRDQYRLAVLEPADDPAEADIAILTVPATSLKNFDQYIRDLAKLKRAQNAVLTLVTFNDEVDFQLLEFEAEKEIKKPAYYKGILERMEDARAAIMEPIDVSNYEAPSKRKKKTKKKAAKKKTAKKKTKRKSKF